MQCRPYVFHAVQSTCAMLVYAVVCMYFVSKPARVILVHVIQSAHPMLVHVVQSARNLRFI